MLGVVCASLGTLVVVGVSASRSWIPVLEPWVPVAPLLGGVAGMLAGLCRRYELRLSSRWKRCG